MRVNCHEGRPDGIGNPADSVNNDMQGSWTCTCYAPAWCPLGDCARPIGLLRHHSIPRMPTHSHVLGFSLACRDLVAKGVRHDGNAALVGYRWMHKLCYIFRHDVLDSGIVQC